MSWLYGEQIWQLLINDIVNPIGVSALMGNLVAESGLIPFRKQGDFSEGYTESLQYTNDVMSGAIPVDTFINDSIGYGLAQWTTSNRKQGLYNLWRNNLLYGLGDVEVQVWYLLQELKTDYSSVYEALKNASSIREASDVVLHDFERPADQSEAVEIERARLGESVYITYVDTPPIVTRNKKKKFNFILFKKRSFIQ